MKVKLNDCIEEVKEVLSYGCLPLLELANGEEWYIAENQEEAGKAARQYWEDLAQDDPQEFTCLVGEKTLVAWSLGQSAGPGSTAVNSLEEWLDLWLDTPEEHFASYDGCEVDVQVVSRDLYGELGFSYDPAGECSAVAYRHN
jgi:hypothetical protein